MSAPLFERIPHFERRPAFITFLALASGIAVGHTTDEPGTVFRIALAGLFLAGGAAFFFRRQPLHLLVSVLTTAFAFGIVLISASLTIESRSILAYFGDITDEVVVLVGDIGEVREGDRLYFRLDCDSVVADRQAYAVTDEAAGIFLTINDTAQHVPLTRGTKVRVFGELSSFSQQRNPYAFDYDGYLRSTEGINAVMYCDSYHDITFVGHSKPGIYEHVLDFFTALRAKTKSALSEIVSDTLVRGFILAMVLGDRKAVEDSIWEDFQRAGLSHILVVSGFNLGIIAWVLYILFRSLRLGRREIRIALVMAGTLFYGALIGPQPSVIRAVIVVELILISRLLERRSDLANVTAGAALIDLALAPGNLFNVSFQLSYGAVFALTLIAPALDRYLFPNREKPKSWFEQCVTGAIGTLAVLLGTLPVVLSHFHQLSVISIVTNLVAIPLASLATILAVMLLPLSAISSTLAALYADAVAMVIYVIRAIVSIAKEISFAVLRLPHPSGAFIALYVMGLLYIIRSSTGKGAAIRVTVLMISFLCISSIGFGLTSSHIRESALTVIFFDVGQGDATLVTTPGGKHYLIDGGGVTRTGNSIAERAIFPFLDAEQLTTIDAAFATHMHLDHYGGLIQLAKERPIDTIYSCGGKAATSYARTLDSIVLANRLPVRSLESGNMLKLDKDVTAYILSPGAHTTRSANERSLVIKLVYRNTSILLLADISGETEEALVRQYGTFLKSDLVKVAHHGSRFSSCDQLTACTQPYCAIFSCGKHNRHGHPHNEVVERWRGSAATIARTDIEGALVFHSDGQTFEKVDWR